MSRISAATKFAKYSEIRKECETAVFACSKKIAEEYEARGNDNRDAVAYTSGYMQSFLVNLIADLPKKQREELVQHLTQRAV